jgi:fumarate reductase flavoprotein subunit
MSDIDVAIMGGGACGMFAALRAAQNPDLSIVIFEKSTEEWCNTQVSSGSLAAGGTRFQAAAGIEDSPQRHADDIIKVSRDESTRNLVEALCAVAPVYTEWLADALDYPIELGVDMPRGGQSVPRLHTDIGRQGGQFFVRRLRDAIAQTPNIAFVDRTPGVGLLAEDGRVVGVRVLETTGEADVRADAVVLATDGFAANAELLAEYIPEVVDDYFSGVSTSTGDALAWAIELGASTRHMGSFLGHGLIVPGHGTRLNPSLPFRGALLVTAEGERFVDEHAHGYSSLGVYVRALPERRAFILWPSDVHEEVLHSELMRESERAGAFGRFDSVSEVCSALGINEATLTQTIDDFICRDIVSGSERKLTFPLYAARITSGILTTQGGLDVDLSGRVIRSSGGVIPGLYAGGGTAVGISGADSRGYSSGNGLLSACGLGWIIGEQLADGIRV